MKHLKTSTENREPRESKNAESNSADRSNTLRERWTIIAPDGEASLGELRESLVAGYLSCLEKSDQALCDLEDMESPIESSAINTEVENAGKTLAVEIDLPGFPTFRLPQPASLARRCERLARRVAAAHWHEPEDVHVVVLGDEVVDESLLDLDNGSEN